MGKFTFSYPQMRDIQINHMAKLVIKQLHKNFYSPEQVLAKQARITGCDIFI